MEELVKQIGSSGGVLLLLIPPLVQVLKKVPMLVKLQETVPVYEIASLALGIGGAYALGLPTPVITGIIAGLAAGKGYDIIRPK